MCFVDYLTVLYYMMLFHMKLAERMTWKELRKQLQHISRKYTELCSNHETTVPIAVQQWWLINMNGPIMCFSLMLKPVEHLINYWYFILNTDLMVIHLWHSKNSPTSCAMSVNLLPVTTWEMQNKFSWNLILGSYFKIYWQILIFVRIGY